MQIPKFLGNLGFNINAPTDKRYFPAMIYGPMKVEFARGNFYLSGRGPGAKLEIKSIGNNQYSIRLGANEKPDILERSNTILSDADLAHICK